MNWNGLTPWDDFLIILFGTWILLTLALQSQSRLTQRIREFDLVSLIPRWTFFSPHPLDLDFVFIVREHVLGRGTTSWRRVLPMPPRLLGERIFANPNRRAYKALADMMLQYAQIAVTSSDGNSFSLPNNVDVERTIPYQILQKIAMSVSHSPGARDIEFAVLCRKDEMNISVLLKSRVHRLP